MKVALYLILLTGLVSLNSCKFLEKHRLFSRDIDTLLDADVAQKPAVVDTTPVVEEPVVAAPTPVAAPVTKTGYGSDKYYMIVGSFQNVNLANSYAEKIQKMGYQTQILESANGFYRVSAKSFSDYKTGVSEIANFRSNVVASAWLHVHN
jgi:cell division protein FtsN